MFKHSIFNIEFYIFSSLCSSQLNSIAIYWRNGFQIKIKNLTGALPEDGSQVRVEFLNRSVARYRVINSDNTGSIRTSGLLLLTSYR